MTRTRKINVTIGTNMLIRNKDGAKAVATMLSTGELPKFVTVIGTELCFGKYAVYVDSVSDNSIYGLINETDAVKELIESGVPYTLNITGQAEGVIAAVISVAGGESKTTEEKTEETAISSKDILSTLPKDIQKIIKEKIKEGIVTREEIDKRLEVLKKVEALKDTFLIKRVFEGYKKYKKPVHQPSTIYQDPYKNSGESIVCEGLRSAAGRQAIILEGEKSVGKNVYVETVAWLLNMPLRLITFSRQMAPSSIYGEKTTDNSAAEALHSEEAEELAKAQKRIELGVSVPGDEEKAAKLELLKAQSASVNIVIDQSELYDWLEDGGIMVFNEMNMAEANFFASFTNQLLDGTGFLFIPGRGEVTINPDCVLFGTQNAEYEGVEEQNEATMSRFGCIVFAQPKTIRPQLTAATKAALKRDGYDADIDKYAKYLDQAETFYRECQMQHESIDGDYGSISNAAMNIRGFVRALTATIESQGFASFKRQLMIHVVNTCPLSDRNVLEMSLKKCVTI